MEAKGLMIGNILYSGLTDKIFTATAEDILNISRGLDEGKIEPVELTRDWLIKLGFESHTGIIFMKKRFGGL